MKIGVAHGHEVMVEKSAGEGIGASDEDYAAAGAKVISTAAELFDAVDMVVKVKEPQAAERGGPVELGRYLYRLRNGDRFAWWLATVETHEPGGWSLVDPGWSHRT